MRRRRRRGPRQAAAVVDADVPRAHARAQCTQVPHRCRLHHMPTAGGDNTLKSDHGICLQQAMVFALRNDHGTCESFADISGLLLAPDTHSLPRVSAGCEARCDAGTT
eukprot:365576-Chlamydomonas_euryale.AAC.15